jgi:hypothetical protein
MQDSRTARGCAAVGLLSIALGAFAPAGAAQPAPDPTVSDVVIDMATLARFADESDNYHLTWHGDDALYGAYGDGWGFARTDVEKRAIGVSRITGTPPNLAGTDTWEGNAQGGGCCWAPWNGKSWGMLSTGQDLHMWFTQGRPRRLGFEEARLATSSDGGRSWRKAGWAFKPEDGVLMPSFLQVGRGYSSDTLPAEVMDYVYSYHARLVATPGHVQTPGAIDLVRVPRDRVADRAAYQFFAGADAAGAPTWTADLAQRRPVLERPHVLDTPPAVTWHPHLERFVMAMPHVPAEDTTRRGVAFLEAPWPWGPWHLIKAVDSFADGTSFFFQFPAKWLGADLTAWLAFTGVDAPTREWDSLDVVKVRFVPAEGAPPG